MHRQTKEDFIQKSKDIFGDKLDYSKVNYVDSRTKITITCKDHGDFIIAPKDHISFKRGCLFCSGERYTTESFIKKCNEIHKNKYIYDKTIYIKSREKCIITCRKHGDFLQAPDAHLRGQGCSKCRQSRKKSIEYHLNKAKNKYEDKFDYSNTKFSSVNDVVEIICKKHGSFYKKFICHINSKHGCDKCREEYSRVAQDDFIKKANKIHNYRYNYSKTKYTIGENNIIVICDQHGEFKVNASAHINVGRGCKFCGKLYTEKDFLEACQKKHYNKYSYENCKFTILTKKINITCKLHGSFLQTARAHMHGAGCPKCIKSSKKDLEYFLLKAKEVHGDKYDYSNIKFISMSEKVKILCPNHGEFYQSPSAHVSSKKTCKKCASDSKKIGLDFFIKRSAKIHNGKYDYSKSIYVNGQSKIEIICEKHGSFFQTATQHMAGRGCNKCYADSMKSNINNIIQKSIISHKIKYDYSKSVYVDCNTKIEIICPKHGSFMQNPLQHANGSDCPYCCGGSCSKIEARWLEHINVPKKYWQKSINATGKIYIVDAYNPETNEIFELYGDYWHGNPELYNPEHINKNNKTKFKELYKETMQREQELLALGYKLVTIWENDFKKILKQLKK